MFKELRQDSGEGPSVCNTTSQLPGQKPGCMPTAILLDSEADPIFLIDRIFLLLSLLSTHECARVCLSLHHVELALVPPRKN